MSINAGIFLNMAKDEARLDVSLPEIRQKLASGYERLQVGGEVTLTRARDYLIGFRDGSSAKGEEVFYASVGPKGSHSD